MNRLIIPVLTTLIALFIFPFKSVLSQDTTWVQTYTWEAQNNPETAYESPGKRWFEFPASDNGVDYRKVLMYYKLKCFEDGTAGNLGYACGEWDYLTYNYLFDHTGLLDSATYTHPVYKINNLDFDVEHIVFEPEGGTPFNTVVDEFSKVVNMFDGSENTASIEGSEETTGCLSQQYKATNDLYCRGAYRNGLSRRSTYKRVKAPESGIQLWDVNP